MKKILTLTLICSAVFATGYDRYTVHFNTNKRYSRNTLTERIQVQRTEPIYRTVTIQTPHRECWDEEVQDSSNKTMGSLIGGAAGGILGHQVGKGRGNTAATIGGAIIGTIVGNNMASNGGTRTVQRCRTTYTTEQEDKLIGYKNYSKYKGANIVKISKNPLRNIILHISW